MKQNNEVTIETKNLPYLTVFLTNFFSSKKFSRIIFVRIIFIEMAISLSITPVCSFKPKSISGIVIGNSVAGKIVRVNETFQNTNKAVKFQPLQAKATGKDGVKLNSLVCTDCEGNGAIACTQCKGEGVNSVDHFNGQFKAGGLCWLCRGKREILCGSCNGAGFLGGFMSTADS